MDFIPYFKKSFLPTKKVTHFWMRNNLITFFERNTEHFTNKQQKNLTFENFIQNLLFFNSFIQKNLLFFNLY